MQVTYVGLDDSSWPQDIAVIALHQFKAVAGADTQRIQHSHRNRDLAFRGYLQDHGNVPHTNLLNDMELGPDSA